MASKISFKNYSKQYDLLLKYSTPYIELFGILEKILQKYFEKENELSVLDIGGGTGNISQLIHDLLPKAKIDIIEPSFEMLEIAQKKLEEKECTFYHVDFQNFQELKTYDLIVCIHALYLMKDSEKLVSKFQKFMNEDSKLIICDVGQEMNISKWTTHLFFTNIKKHGIIQTIKILLSGKDVRKSNKEIQRKQRSGEIWKHTLKEFKGKFSEGYNVIEEQTCFLNCSNLLVASKGGCEEIQ